MLPESGLPEWLFAARMEEYALELAPHTLEHPRLMRISETLLELAAFAKGLGKQLDSAQDLLRESYPDADEPEEPASSDWMFGRIHALEDTHHHLTHAFKLADAPDHAATETPKDN